MTPPRTVAPAPGTPNYAARLAQYNSDLAAFNAARATAYSNVRRNYVTCADWGNERNFNGGRKAKHQGLWGGFAGGDGYTAQYTCHDGEAFFDDKCQLVKKADVIKRCGALNVVLGELALQWIRHTPVSLILNESGKPTKDYTLVKFPFDQGKINQYWEWRGSDEAPLLVYDPEHKGDVTSAHQLFGNWTFGGKRLATLEQQVAQPWKHGFEPLAELDADGDGKIAGSELEPLALWFDSNRDAVAQAGEVRRIGEAGITALFFSADRVDPLTGDVITTIGYERTVSGKTSVGAAVDWIARGRDSAVDTVIGRLLEHRADTHNVAGATAEVRASDSAHSSSDVSALNKGLAGLWSVSVGTEGASNPSGDGSLGFLSFNDGDSAAITGSSVLELGVTNPEGGDMRMMKFASFSGEITSSSDSSGSFWFNAESNGNKLENQATVDLSSGTMKGSTTATSSGQRFTYSWSAKRVVLGQNAQ
jgi:hypothetical protein